MIASPNALPTMRGVPQPTLDSGRIASARKLLCPLDGIGIPTKRPEPRLSGPLLRDATLSGTMVDEPRHMGQASARESEIAVVRKC